MNHHFGLSKSWGLCAILSVAAASCAVAEAERPYLINFQQPGYQSEPRFIRDRFRFIDTLPFDGLTITTDSGSQLMNGVRRTYAQMALDFGPLTRVAFKRLKHNFALVNVDRPADFFDDWTVTIQNFRWFARILRSKRIEGIFFDNEEYARALFNYPENCSYPSKSLQEYQNQARLRGRQVMEAMVREYPKLVLVALHGPYSSFEETPEDVHRGQTDWRNEELRGSFSVGMMEGLGKNAVFVDGGEVYTYRTEEDFQNSYDYRKTTIAEADCPFIPEFLRSLWSQKTSIAFGAYNRPFAGAAMDPPILGTTLEHALRRADKYVWLYSEQLDWNAPGETPQAWIDSVAGARAAIGSSPLKPTVAITSPTNNALLGRSKPVTLTAAASCLGRAITKVEFFNGTAKLGESHTPPFSYVWIDPPRGTCKVTAVATDETGASELSSPVTLNFRNGFAVRVNFQLAGVTPAVGYIVDSGETYSNRENGLTYGWNVSHAGNARHRRSANIDLHLATLCQMQSGAKWEIAVPNGRYHVTVGIGDCCYASTYTINVEGTNFWAEQPLQAGRFCRRTKTVFVSDGKLTLDQGTAGFEATRVNYITIVQA